MGSIDTSIFGSFADWLTIDMPRYAYEGDRVVVRCSGKKNDKIVNLIYYKDRSRIATYSNSTSHIISNAKPSDSGIYYCKASKNLFSVKDELKETSPAQLTVQGEALTIQTEKTGEKWGLCGRTRVKSRGDHPGQQKFGVAVCL